MGRDLRDKVAADMTASVLAILEDENGALERHRDEIMRTLRAHLEPRSVDGVEGYLDKYPLLRTIIAASTPKLLEQFPGRPIQTTLHNWQEECHVCGEGQFLTMRVVVSGDTDVEDAFERMEKFEDWYLDYTDGLDGYDDLRGEILINTEWEPDDAG